MVTKIIKTEWLNLLAEKSFMLLAAVLLILIAYSVWSGATWVKQRRLQTATLLEKQEKDIAEAKEKTAQRFNGSTTPGNFQPDPSDPYTIGMGLQYASLPFSSGAVFSIGQWVFGQAKLLPVHLPVFLPVETMSIR